MLGETKVLPCKVVNRLGPLQWTKDGFGLGITWELNGFGRYRYTERTLGRDNNK